jgi:2-hydroxychromene-2-carboxylate isomerase
MAPRLEYFFDYVSPFSYLADSQVPAIVERTGADIVYRPFLLGGVMQASGNSPPITVPNKGKYMFADIARWLARYQIELKMNPHFPVNTVKAMRGALVALEEGNFPAYHAALFKATWRDEQNVGDADTLRALLDAAGLDGAAILARTDEPAIKELLKTNTAEAVERGAFGAPTFFGDGEQFFGTDRLDFLEEKLENTA